ncbi:unnamed protein product [Pieris brassicae]|uniref:RNA-directed DNA polymerase n=1 Tax=Pieris brassicae TaxID=7116 RepID=A0A9P0TMG9_PIEBR|nr:unnamed protein product [Pieris brassicae]
MQEMGICRPSKSPWSSPLHVVPKKNGEIRPCGDYRRLNAITKPDRYPVPRLHDFAYLLDGHTVCKNGIPPLDSKIEIIKNYPKPKTIDELRRFLGMVNFYRSHIPNAVRYQIVLNKYLRGAKKKDKTPIVWTFGADEAFDRCKACLQEAVTLSAPRCEVPISLMTDASNSCVGAVLQQYVDNKWKPLGYFSQKNSDAQTKYSTYDRELLAIYLAIRHFKDLSHIDAKAASSNFIMIATLNAVCQFKISLIGDLFSL